MFLVNHECPVVNGEENRNTQGKPQTLTFSKPLATSQLISSILKFSNLSLCHGFLKIMFQTFSVFSVLLYYIVFTMCLLLSVLYHVLATVCLLHCLCYCDVVGGRVPG